MASRRLDISSLLCDDSHPTPFSPLEALVHAATEEKRRLDQGQQQQQQQQRFSIAHLISNTDQDQQPLIKKPRYSLSPTSDDITRERDKMFVGELGYGRVEPVVPSFPPRRPGSGHGHPRKPVAVADLLSPPIIPTSHSRLLSPLGRRSPPGSQIGRAKAARKSDEYQHQPRPPPPPDRTKPHKEEDAHEWFIQQFDQVPSPTRLKPPHSPSPPALPLKQEPLVVKEQEPEPQMDLDVDLAVTELVQTLEDDVKPPTMEVDVEDELLSLVDDRPAPSSSSAPARRPPHSLPPATPATASSSKPASTSASEPRHVSPSPVIPMAVASAVRHPSTRPASERGSMPPPASTTAGKKGAERAGSIVPAPKKKKEPKPKTKATSAVASASTSVPAKPKPKPTAKSKKVSSPADAHFATPSVSRSTKAPPVKKNAPSGSRSRSTSVMPDAAKAEKQEEEEDSDGPNEDDKLYCVCKTRYDEDRFMIACDKCDEWYHTQCVHMPDFEVDLVDQFICPPCIEKEPHLNLRTTYKMRCLYGLQHPDPSSTKACHKAARGALSKYCSDECGVKYMQSRIDSWSKKGGKPEKLWESVKNAEKREGVVVCTIQPDDTAACAKMEIDDGKDAKPPLPPPPPKRVVQAPLKSKLARETERLDGLLDSVIKLREEINKGMEAVIWRERLLQLASERAELMGQCGWDQRLCLDDEEWADVGAGVLESYEHVKAESTKENGVDGEMEVDGSEEQWWCPGQKVCDRHQGWQTVRYKDVSKEKEKKEEALVKLTTREREIRRRIEDMLDPQDKNKSNTIPTNPTVKETTAHPPLKTKAVNGHPKSKGATSTADSLKKGKKRKAPAA